MPFPRGLTRHPRDREIARLAVPALGALLAEPLFLLVDTALVGHLGTTPLAGLGIAGAILQGAVGLLVFLAYAMTPQVARLLGSGDRRGALRAGIDGLWLGFGIGMLLLLLGLVAAPALVASFGADEGTTRAATEYLTVSLWGLPAMLLVLSATGLLRGLQDTRTPLVVAGVGFTANAALNAVFLYGFGWGIAGSAAGTVIAQWGMAAAYLVMAWRAARREGATVRPRLVGIAAVAASGGWLLLRTVSLRIGMLATVVAGVRLGVSSLAALQVALVIFSTLALALDALAIAGQAMSGHGLGRSDIAGVRAISRRLQQLGVLAGVVIGVGLVALAPLISAVFTPDPDVSRMLVPLLIVMALGIPLAGFVFVLDGVLIGAGDARYLALTGIANLAVYLGLLLAVAPVGNLLLIWTAFGIGYLGSRALTLGLRARGKRWLVSGSGRAPAASRQ